MGLFGLSKGNYKDDLLNRSEVQLLLQRAWGYLEAMVYEEYFFHDEGWHERIRENKASDFIHQRLKSRLSSNIVNLILEWNDDGDILLFCETIDGREELLPLNEYTSDFVDGVRDMVLDVISILTKCTAKDGSLCRLHPRYPYPMKLTDNSISRRDVANAVLNSPLYPYMLTQGEDYIIQVAIYEKHKDVILCQNKTTK